MLNDRQHVEGVAIMRRLTDHARDTDRALFGAREKAIALDTTPNMAERIAARDKLAAAGTAFGELIEAATMWLAENHPKPGEYMAALSEHGDTPGPPDVGRHEFRGPEAHDSKRDIIHEAITRLARAVQDGDEWDAGLSLLTREAKNYAEELVPPSTTMIEYARERWHLRHRAEDAEEQVNSTWEKACDLFNPRDDYLSTVDVLTDAHEYIDAQPCTCTPEQIEDHEACPRCIVLGRLDNKAVIR